jgi:hypothetical protein
MLNASSAKKKRSPGNKRLRHFSDALPLSYLESPFQSGTRTRNQRLKKYPRPTPPAKVVETTPISWSP